MPTATKSKPALAKRTTTRTTTPKVALVKDAPAKVVKNKRYTTDKQAAANLANALTHLPDNWVMCRDMRHAWKVEKDFHVTEMKGKRVQTLGRVLACMRCETLRIEAYVHNGYGLDKISQHYSYPEGYQIKGVPRGVKPQSIIQEEQYRRTMHSLAEQHRGA